MTKTAVCLYQAQCSFCRKSDLCPRVFLLCQISAEDERLRLKSQYESRIRQLDEKVKAVRSKVGEGRLSSSALALLYITVACACPIVAFYLSFGALTAAC